MKDVPSLDAVIKAYHHAETFFKLISAVDPAKLSSRLRTMKFTKSLRDDYKVDLTKEDEMKSEEGKAVSYISLRAVPNYMLWWGQVTRSNFVRGIGLCLCKHLWGERRIQTDFKHDLTAKKRNPYGGQRAVTRSPHNI